MFTIALPKGALLKDSISTFKRAGLDFSDALEKNNRSLTFESNCKRAKALLVRNGDVPVYVSYGQADLGIVGYDVLRESELKVAKLLDSIDKIVSLRKLPSNLIDNGFPISLAVE